MTIPFYALSRGARWILYHFLNWSGALHVCPTLNQTNCPSKAILRPTHPKDLWIDPVQFLTLINGLELAHWACTIALLWTQRLHLFLPPARHPGGAPRVYSDETVLLTMLVLRA